MTTSDFRPMYISTRSKDGIECVSFRSAQLTEEMNIELMGRELFALVEQCGVRKIALSLQSVAFASSAALGKLITLHRKLHRLGGMLVLCDIGEDLRESLRSSRLLNYFHTSSDLDGALALLR